MKNAKKVLAMVIVLALAISMAIPVSAAEQRTATITINGSQAGVKYSVYKMATLSQSIKSETDLDGEQFSYVIEEGWKAFFEDYKVKRDDGEGNEVMVNAFVIGEADPNFDVLKVADGITLTDAEMKAMADAAIAYAENDANNISATATKTVGNGASSVEFTGLDTGYYCVSSTLGSRVIVDTLENVGVTITEKTDIPTLEKFIGDANGIELKVVDVAVGDTVYYTIKIKVKTGAEGYYVEDVLPAGLTLDATSASVSVDGQTINDLGVNVTYVSGNTYKFEIVNEEKIEVALNDALTGDNENYTELVLKYSATVGSGVAKDIQNQNTAKLYYGENFKSNESTASFYTWSFVLNKYTDNVEKLAGAKFEVYSTDPETDGAEPLTFTQVKDAEDNDVPGTYVFDKDGTVSEFTTSSEFNFTFTGLDQGTYYLKEVDAPAGYNKLKDAVEMKIESSIKEATTEKLVATYTYEGDNDQNSIADGNTIKIYNGTGVELPSTGGTGTVIFIAVGSFLVMAMGVLLVVRKRMSKVVYTR